jgi:tryptophan halogenase
MINSITIVGGGTAGFVSALILQKKFGNTIKIRVIRSKKIGIIGVGEGSTEHWADFLGFIGVEHKDVIKKCDATIKCGIMFREWSKNDYIHNVSEPYDIRYGQERLGYTKMIVEKDSIFEMVHPEMLINKVSIDHANNFTTPVNQYHFNTQKLNDFLTELSINRNIEVIDDEIKDIILKENGEINYLIGEKTNYDSDFYIDSTGFKRFLISKLGAVWKSYEKHLKLNTAIVFPTEDTDNYNTYTTATAMKYGWMFNIPVFGRHGNGYIFDSNYITSDEAKNEIELKLGRKIESVREIKFIPGALEKVWIKNCYAIGLSANFVEPLEATSIGTSISQSYLLAQYLINYDDDTIEHVNKQVNSIMINIRDFIFLHYLTDRNDTKFWQDIKKIEIPYTLKQKMKLWKNKLPCEEDFNEQSRFCLFRDRNFILILHGLNLINKNKLQNVLDKTNIEILDELTNRINKSESQFKKDLIDGKFITHKEYLLKMRG